MPTLSATISCNSWLMNQPAKLHISPALCAVGSRLKSYLKEARLFGSGRDFGYLKPIFRKERLKALQLEYDERLRIAEDDDLILRALASGLRYWYEPTETYLYRQHSSSTSHRLSSANAAAMCAASAELLARFNNMPGRLLHKRHSSLVRGWAFIRLVDAIKEKQWMECLRIAAAHPNAIPLLRMPLAAALTRSSKSLNSRSPRSTKRGARGIGAQL